MQDSGTQISSNVQPWHPPMTLLAAGPLDLTHPADRGVGIGRLKGDVLRSTVHLRAVSKTSPYRSEGGSGSCPQMLHACCCYTRTSPKSLPDGTGTKSLELASADRICSCSACLRRKRRPFGFSSAFSSEGYSIALRKKQKQTWEELQKHQIQLKKFSVLFHLHETRSPNRYTMAPVSSGSLGKPCVRPSRSKPHSAREASAGGRRVVPPPSGERSKKTPNNHVTNWSTLPENKDVSQI